MILYALITALQVAVAPVFNREPLEPTSYAQLPLGAIKPDGWLKEQLQRQATGLTGNLDQVYPQVMGDSNAWLGGDGDAWERGPYWIDGLLPLAYILDNQELKTKALRWVNAILDSQQEDGYMGPREDHPFVYGLQRGKSHDWWPKMVALKILQQATAAIHQCNQTTLGAVVLLVDLHVLSQFGDALREDGDLNFDGTDVVGRTLILLDDFLLGFLVHGFPLCFRYQTIRDC